MRDHERQAVLAVLDEVDCPLRFDELVPLLSGGYRYALGKSEFDEIAYRERKDYEAGTPRQAWICPALNLPHGTTDRAFLTRSDWPIGHRLVDDAFEHARRLWLLQQVCLRLETADSDPLLERLAADLARELSRGGAPPEGGRTAWKRVAQAEHATMVPLLQPLVEQGSYRLRSLSAVDLLFGR